MKFSKKNILTKGANWVLSNSVWFIPFALGLFFMSRSAIKETVIAVVVFEALAIGITSIAAFILSRSETMRYQMWNALGNIFLGVHVCIGLVVLGVYFTQI
ncbi:MAG: hypothetical protein N3A67_01625 [Ignavibacteria bacterium]|nr:hypothetical protein [Ignavibacteria bacterium]